MGCAISSPADASKGGPQLYPAGKGSLIVPAQQAVDGIKDNPAASDESGPHGPISLATTSVALGRSSAALPAEGRSLVLIVWDIENVRLPLDTAPGLSPKHVVRYLKKHFIHGPGRHEYRAVCCVTERSLARIRRDHPAFVEQVVPDMSVLLASAVHAKRNADVALKKEIHHFTAEYAAAARSCPGCHTLVLLTGDEDFLEPAQAALAAGFRVELLAHDTASRALLGQAYSRPPLLWGAFLRAASGVADLVLPYGDEQLHSALGLRSLVLAATGPRRGAQAARAQALRLLRGRPAAGASPAGAAVTDASNGRNGGGVSSAAAAEPEVLLMEPSFGDFSGSCCVVVRVPEGEDVGALAAYLRQQQQTGYPVAGDGAAPGRGGEQQGGRGAGGDAQMAVFEPWQFLRIVLQVDDAMPHLPFAAGVEGADATDAVPETAEPHLGSEAAPATAAAGRSAQDRLFDASDRMSAVLRAYRPPRAPATAHDPRVGATLPAPASPGQTAGSAAARHHHQQPFQPQHALQLLCRFSQVPGPDQTRMTLLAAVLDAAADMARPLSYLISAAAQVQLQHGVTAWVEALFPSGREQAGEQAGQQSVASSPGQPGEGDTLVAPVAGSGAGQQGQGADTGAVLAPTAAALTVSAAADLAVHAPQPPPGPPPLLGLLGLGARRLPALPARPQDPPQPASPDMPGPGSPDEHGQGGAPQLQQSVSAVAVLAEPAVGRSGAGVGVATAGATAVPAASVADGSPGKKKKKKNKKNKKKRNKRNSVVPLP